MLLLPPGSACRLAADARADVLSLRFGRSLIDPLALNGSVDLVVEMIGTTEPTVARLSAAECEEARLLFASLEREAAARNPGYRGMVRLKLMEAILLLSRARRGGRTAEEQAPLRFHPAEAMEYIQAHSADTLSLSGLAARYGMNPSYFSRLFRSRAGVPLVEYINRIRIRESCRLLKSTEAGIVEIALAVGYNNLSHFNRYFRRIVGMNPREYRNSGKR